MTCEQVRARLTAYLDGELEDERGSAVRGHLRACAACRQAATDESTLRDGLRALPPIDPPPSLWAGVQARLAAAEIADAERPAWRAALARWLSPRVLAPRLPILGAVVAAVVLMLAWRAHRAHDDGTPAPTSMQISQQATTSSVAPSPASAGAAWTTGNDGDDVTIELAALPAAHTRSYADAADQLLSLARDARAGWSDDAKRAFDARVTELQAAVAHADDEPANQRAYRALIRYVQRAVVRDEFAVNDGARGRL